MAPSSTKPQGETNKLKKSILTLAFGQSAAMLVSVTLSPLLTRTFNPDAFGSFNLLLSFASVASVVGALQYHRAIPQERNATEQSTLFLLSVLCTITSTLALSALFFLLEPISIKSSDRSLSTALFAGLLLVTTISSVVNVSLNTIGLNGTVAARAFLLKAGAVVTQIAIGLLSGWKTSAALVLGYLIAATASNALGLSRAVRHHLITLNRLPDFDQLKTSAIRHRDYPKSMVPAELLQAIGLNLPTLLLGFFYPLSIVGLYSLAFRITKLPASIFMTSASQIYYISCAKQVGENASPSEAAHETASLIAALAAFPLMCIAFLGPKLFSGVFGEEWRTAGTFAQFMSPWILLTTIYGHLPAIFAAKNRLNVQFVLSGFNLVSRFTALTLASLYLTAEATILLYSITNIASSLYIYQKAAKLTELNLARSAMILSPTIALAIGLAAVAAVCDSKTPWEQATPIYILLFAVPNYFVLRMHIIPLFRKRQPKKNHAL